MKLREAECEQVIVGREGERSPATRHQEHLSLALVLALDGLVDPCDGCAHDGALHIGAAGGTRPGLGCLEERRLQAVEVEHQVTCEDL